MSATELAAQPSPPAKGRDGATCREARDKQTPEDFVILKTERRLSWALCLSIMVAAWLLSSAAQASAGLSTDDLGSTGGVGSLMEDDDRLTMTGSGVDIGGREDDFTFAHKLLRDDGEIVVRLADFQAPHPAAKAGIMMSERLAAGARNVFVAFTPGRGMVFGRRTTTGGWSQQLSFPGAAPGWLRLVRTEDVFSGYASSNGVDWALLGEVAIPMIGDIHVGLAVASHDNAARATASFDGLRVAEVPMLPGRGTVTAEHWSPLPGFRLNDLLLSPAYPHRPSGAVTLTRLQMTEGLGERHGARIRAQVHPPVTGEYTFWIAASGPAELYLSDDASPSGRALIARVADATSWREWTRRPDQRSPAVHLEAGMEYHLEILYRTSAGVPHLSVGWSLPGGAETRPDEVLHGNAISPHVPPAPEPSRGLVGMEIWDDLAGWGLSSLSRDPRYPSSPSRALTFGGLTSTEDLGDRSACRVRAYLHPPLTGAYTFWIAASNESELYLSADTDPMERTFIARVPRVTGPMEWNRYPEQRSAAVELVAGRAYYLEVLKKGSVGADHLAVGWRLPGSAAAVPLEVPSGDHVSLFTQPDLAISAPRDGEGIFPGGVLLSGVAGAPEDGIEELRLWVHDSRLGLTVDGAPLAREPTTGAWSFLLGEALYAPGSAVEATVTMVTGGREPRRFSERARLEVVPLPRLDWSMGAPGRKLRIDDASGNGNAARAGAAGIEVGSTEPAAADGGTCGYARLSNGPLTLDAGTPGLGLTRQVTATAWVRWGIHPETGARRAFIVGESLPSTGRTTRFWLGHSANNERFEFGVRVPGGDKIASGGVPQAGRWVHLAGVYDGRDIHLYVDGEKIQRSMACNPFPCAAAPLIAVDPAQQLTAGRSADARRAFEGDIDEVRVYDAALSAAQIRREARPLRPCAPAVDTAPPRVEITSHQDGAPVADSGFLLSGVLTDDVEASDVFITVDDPVLGRVLDGNRVTLRRPEGRFSLAVLPDQITPGETITVTVTGIDGAGNTAQAVTHLRVLEISPAVHHLLSRVTFGATRALLAEVQDRAPPAYLEQQLYPDSIDDARFEASLAALPVTSHAELKAMMLRRAIGSRRQLREVMTWFWENHFNTDFNKHRDVALERVENDGFRAAALGRFRDLLGLSARSPAMLYYLNNARSRTGAPNEDYARELMELHTLGVDGGYTSADVANVARVFTGWRVSGRSFSFDARSHDAGSKVVLSRVIPPGGVGEGDLVLDLLASHPSTARYLCGKLARVFVDDNPSPGLVESCAGVFLSTGGEMAAVVRHLINSPDFSSAACFRSKVKTPLEFMASMARGEGLWPNHQEMVEALDQAAMNLFAYPIPTGYPERGADWLNGLQLIERIKVASRFAVWNRAADAQTAFDIQPLLDNRAATSSGVARYLAAIPYSGSPLPAELANAEDILDAEGEFQAGSPRAAQRLRMLQAALLSSPGNFEQ